MNSFIFTYNGFLENWTDYFLTNSMEILFLAIPAAIFSLFFKNKSPRFHYILWTIVLVKALIPSDIINIQTPQIYTIELPTVITTTFSQTIEPTLNLYQSVFFMIWIGIASFLLIKLVVNSISFRKLLQSKTEITSTVIDKIKNHFKIKKNIQIYEANIDVPFTMGIVNPKIFLPKNSDYNKVEFIIAHEIAHIKRNDFLMILIQNIITIAFFFHPIVLIASGFLNYYREIICDEMAMEAINSSPKNYGRKIIDYLEFCLKQKKYPILANGFIFSKKIIIKRIEYLINRQENVMKKLSKFQIVLVGTLVVIMGLIISCSSTIGVKEKIENNQTEEIVTRNIIIIGNADSNDSVLVNIQVGKNVNSSKFKIIKNSGKEELDAKALEVIQKEDFISNLNVNNIKVININITFEKNPNIHNPEVKFIPYDDPPEPIGGFAAIQNNVMYPEDAQNAGIEGTVVIQGFVNKNGIVGKCNVLRGIPDSGLDEAAINAIKKTKFTPAKQKDKNVGVWVSIPVVFKLSEEVK